MELHEKLKNARVESGVSQKEAADKIGVSRQTLSSWETGKTYPDIASLISLSDLYRVSIDALLKEDKADSAYVAYIDKAIGVIKNKQRIYKALEIGGFLLLLIIYVVLYLIESSSSESGTESVLAMHSFLIPSVIVILSLLIGIDDAWGEKRWFLILFFGASFCFAEQFTLILSDFPVDKSAYWLNLLRPASYSMGAFLSFVGLGIGALAKKFK